MEIIKSQIDDRIVRLDIGTEYNEDKKELIGSVELDIENQGHFVDIINSVLDEGHSFILVDMQNISYIDSSGLWALFEGHKKAVQKNGRMVLLNPTKDVRRVLDITKMSSKMQIAASLDDALKALRAE